MSIAVIAAMARNGVIGRARQLPWRLPEDLRRFKAITMGHVLLMGRTTFDSIGRPLPGRRTIVVTRQAAWYAPGVDVAHSIDEALDRAGDAQVFVAGGGDIYRQTIDRACRLYLTLIDQDVVGDTFFPPFDRAGFRVVEEERHVGVPLPFEFLTLERLVSRNTDTLPNSPGAAPDLQGARSEHVGNIRATSNAARRDAPPGKW